MFLGDSFNENFTADETSKTISTAVSLREFINY